MYNIIYLYNYSSQNYISFKIKIKRNKHQQKLSPKISIILLSNEYTVMNQIYTSKGCCYPMLGCVFVLSLIRETTHCAMNSAKTCPCFRDEAL